MKKSIFLCVLLFLMLFHADYVTEGARNGLLLWYTSVVPALFPFMVLSGLLSSGGSLKILMKPFYLFLHPFLGLSHDGCYVFISGLLCGYPMGAKTCADFLSEGRISTQEGRFLMAVSNHPSPMFLLGFVYPLIKEQIGLKEFLLAIYGPVVLIAAFAKSAYLFTGRSCASSGELRASFNRPRASSCESCAKSWNLPADARQVPPNALLTSPKTADEMILSAVEILCKIGGYLILFSIAIVFLHHADQIPQLPRVLLTASMEMTTGVQEVTKILSSPWSGAAACAALTFGGFSGIFQTKAVIKSAAGPDEYAPSEKQNSFPDACHPNKKSAGLSIRHYMFWKILHAGLSFFVFLWLY